MLPGAYLATKKDGQNYYRSNITYRSKHISLGSFRTENLAHKAYLEAQKILDENSSYTLDNCFSKCHTLTYDKVICLLNFRDNRMYIKNPIYLRANFFIYFLSPTEELKFDIDDLFFYSSHRILRRQGHLYVNDYGMQLSILSRYGIRNYAVAGKDYTFANGDTQDFRYSNLIVTNKYMGVSAITVRGNTRYRAQIHINGNYKIGTYLSAERAAVAYNKAIDLALAHGISKNFTQNYVLEYSPKEYADVYTSLKISEKYLNYLKELTS